jgi:hypothetical protein
MASIFKKEPIFSHKRLCDNTTKLPEKYKFSGRAGKVEVHLDSGSLGMELFYEKTLPDYILAATKLDWDWYETFSQFENVLEGSYKTAWREVLRDTSPMRLPSLKKTKLAFITPCAFLSALSSIVRRPETSSTSIWPRAGTTRSGRTC